MVRTAAILTLLCGAIESTADAQSRWLPRGVDMGPYLTGENRAAAIARLEAIDRLLKQVPELAHPDGFEIRPFFQGAGSGRRGLNDSEHADYVLPYTYRLVFFYPSLAENKYAIGEMIFGINADENMRGSLDPQGRTVFVEDARWPSTPFSVVTYGVSPSGRLQPNDGFRIWSWFTAGAELPWRAVSREDYYNALIADVEGNKGERRAQYKKDTEKTPYERWLEEAPQRKKDREEVLKALAQIQPAAEVAKLRKTMEDGERDAGEQFKKNENDDRANAKAAFKPTDDMRAELNRMTPAERKLPAIIDTDINRTELRATGASMIDRDTVTATVHRVLTPNYDFWRARRSRVEVRTINVYVEGPDAPPVRNAVYQMYRKFDWRALAALIDQPSENKPKQPSPRSAQSTPGARVGARNRSSSSSVTLTSARRQCSTADRLTPLQPNSGVRSTQCGEGFANCAAKRPDGVARG